MAVEVSVRELLRLREFTQRIHPVAAGTVADTVGHLLAVQAQDFGNALWAIGVRTKDSVRSDVLSSLERGEIVRTLPMRGTLHVVAAEDLRWMLDLTSARSLQSTATRFGRLGLDPATLERAESLTREALAGRSMTRDEFMTLLDDHGIWPGDQRGYHVIFYLTQRSLLCWGPPSGTGQALVLVDDWIPRQPERPSREAALAQFASRYFASHGPATERDFAWWSKLTLTDVRAAIASCGDGLTELTCGGASYWIARTELDAASGSRVSSAVHALPGFDEYLLGYQDRSLALAAEHAHRIVPGGNGIFLPTIVAKGRVVGTWRRIPKSKGAEIEPQHFDAARTTEHADFAKAAMAYARFVGG